MNKPLRSQRRANRFYRGKSIFKQLICYYFKPPCIVVKDWGHENRLIANMEKKRK